MIIFILFIFGLALGSFVNALVWRVHQQQGAKSAKQRAKLSITKGRSMCPDCRHTLAMKDLVPVFSWLMLKGRCRYCNKPISWQYPAVEMAMAATFVLSYIFWPGAVDSAEDWLLFGTWLASSVGLLALLVYDFRWMLLPNRILYPTAFVAISGRLAYIFAYETDKTQALLSMCLSIAVASGIFFLLYIVSSGRWIGFGDVRLGFITGALLANPVLSLLMIFIASLLGTLFVLPDIISRKKTIQAKLPYGPFLIIATAICLLSGQSLIDWYEKLIFI